MNSNIRNFSIIAHIDHGKSTLSDRLLEYAHAVSPNQMHPQLLDDMDLERERGITIKAKSIRFPFVYNNETYIFNLIDTPGHVDFTYEVSRSLRACEGTILVVDATQGVEAQTFSNYLLAKKENLSIIPVINKIDLPNANIPGTIQQIRGLFGENVDILRVSAKTGEGVPELMKKIIEKVPPPPINLGVPLRALIFDSVYDSYKGVIIYLRIIDGVVKKGSKIRLLSVDKEFEVNDLGYFLLKPISTNSLSSGEVGYLVAGIKDVESVKIGDTVTTADSLNISPLPGFSEVKPFVFCGLYPVDNNEFPSLSKAIEKLHLNDPSFVYQLENSPIFGYGFRCGFLGVLHMDIVKERIQREYNLELVLTSPNVIYRVKTNNEELIEIDNPGKFPPYNNIRWVEEPMVKISVITPLKYLSQITELVKERRGKVLDILTLGEERVVANYKLPLAEMIVDFYDQLKSVSHGYASLDYQHIGWERGDLTKLEILIQNKPIDVFSLIVPQEKAFNIAHQMVNKLKAVIPRHIFAVSIQAKVKNKIVARQDIAPLRKDVISKCYGGDITRKRKLLEKQKVGKKRMKSIGQVDVPLEVFVKIVQK